MFGFRNCVGMLNELCCNKDLTIIAVQKHWIRADDLNEFNLVHSDYNFHFISSKCSAASVGILKGRPFDGVAFLCDKSVNGCINFIQFDLNGRCLVFKLNLGQKSILLFNLYLPCNENSAEYRAEIAFYVGFIENILNTVPYSDIIILGDTTFDNNDANAGCSLLKPLLLNRALRRSY